MYCYIKLIKYRFSCIDQYIYSVCVHLEARALGFIQNNFTHVWKYRFFVLRLYQMGSCAPYKRPCADAVYRLCEQPNHGKRSRLLLKTKGNRIYPLNPSPFAYSPRSQYTASASGQSAFCHPFHCISSDDVHQTEGTATFTRPPN